MCPRWSKRNSLGSDAPSEGRPKRREEVKLPPSVYPKRKRVEGEGPGHVGVGEGLGPVPEND